MRQIPRNPVALPSQPSSACVRACRLHYRHPPSNSQQSGAAILAAHALALPAQSALDVRANEDGALAKVDMVGSLLGGLHSVHIVS